MNTEDLGVSRVGLWRQSIQAQVTVGVSQDERTVRDPVPDLRDRIAVKPLVQRRVIERRRHQCVDGKELQEHHQARDTRLRGEPDLSLHSGNGRLGELLNEVVATEQTQLFTVHRTIALAVLPGCVRRHLAAGVWRPDK